MMIAGYRCRQVAARASSAAAAAASSAAVQMVRRSLASGVQYLREAYRSDARIRCSLCRRRHKEHYADLRIMPTGPVKLLVGAVLAA